MQPRNGKFFTLWLGGFNFEANQAINPATVHELAKRDRSSQPICSASSTMIPSGPRT